MCKFRSDLAENGRGGYLLTKENPKSIKYPKYITLGTTQYKKIVCPCYRNHKQYSMIEYMPISA